MKKVPHQYEGGIVEYGTHRSDKDHEELDCIDVPFERLNDQFFIHIVCGNSSLGKIIEEVVRQDLHGEHWKERQQVTRSNNAEHVAKIGTRAHPDILDDICKDFSAFDNPLFKHKEVFFEKHDVSGLLGNVNPGINGNPDISGFEGRRIVNPVSHESHHPAAAAQFPDNLFLLGRGNFHEDIHIQHGP